MSDSNAKKSAPLIKALYVNAALLLAILAAVLLRGSGEVPSLLPAALAQGQPGLTGGNGVYVMPGQLSTNTYGCYLLDTDSQTLCVYQYMPEMTIRLVAARSFKFDRQLANFNTDPSPEAVKDLVDRASRAGSSGPGIQRPNDR